jgi:hypothetical protein
VATSTDASLFGLWHMEETGGTGAYIKDSSGNKDGSGNSYHGTPTGTTVVDGIFGKARSFGSSDYITIPIGMSVSSTGFWINPSTTTIANNILQLTSGAYITANTSGQITVTGITSPSCYVNGLLTTCASAGAALNPSQWNYVVVTSATGITTANTPYLGRVGSTSMYGKLDEVSFYNRALSADEIAEQYRLGSGHRITGIIPAVDLTNSSKIPFWVAADRPGAYMEFTVGNNAFANYEADANTVLLIHGDEVAGSTSIKDYSPSGISMTAAGNAKTSTTGKIGNSIYVNGGSDNLSGTLSVDPGYTNTIDAWVYPITGAVSKTIITASKLTTNSSSQAVYGSCTSPNALTLNTWTHIAGVSNGSGSCKLYLNGSLASSNTTGATFGTAVNIGASSFTGYIDEVRISNSVRTPSDIRAAYEIGKRSHTINIDFTGSMSGNLITGSGDTGFTISTSTGSAVNSSGGNAEYPSATGTPTLYNIPMLYVGDKIIVKENYNGVEYLAQGSVAGLTQNSTSTAVTVSGWDANSTFPSGGFSSNAVLFKWQREYFDPTGITTGTGSADSINQRNAVTSLTLRMLDGNEGRNIWLDDVEATSYLTDPAGSTIISDNLHNRYIQYRAILSSNDWFVTPALSMVTINYQTAPSVITLTPTSLSTSTATLNGNVTSDGGASLTAMGFDYYSSNPAALTTVTTTPATGLYNIPLTGLSLNTTYYYRAWATNAVGTTTASYIPFTTWMNTNKVYLKNNVQLRGKVELR